MTQAVDFWDDQEMDLEFVNRHRGKRVRVFVLDFLSEIPTVMELVGVLKPLTRKSSFVGINQVIQNHLVRRVEFL